VKDLDLIRLKKIGRRLLELRLQKNLTQKELAFLVDVEISQITRIERGIINTSILNLMRITDALEISISEFLKDIEIKA
jgi:transcriptional regulator with XRE-family HTH domain